jgi:hypothetical protein
MKKNLMKLTEPVSIVSFCISLYFVSFNSLGVISIVAGFVVSHWISSSATFNRLSMISVGDVNGVLDSK